MVSGKEIEISKKLAELLIAILDIMENDKKVINVTSKSIKEDVTRSKDKEKDEIVTRLGNMSDMQRQVENIKKNLKLLGIVTIFLGFFARIDLSNSLANAPVLSLASSLVYRTGHRLSLSVCAK